MSPSLPKESVMAGLREVMAIATENDLMTGCRCILDRSTLVHASSNPYSENDLEAIANGIYFYITSSDISANASYDIALESTYPIVGSRIDILEFANMFSEEFLFQCYSPKYTTLSASELLTATAAFFTALCFRYRHCCKTETSVLRATALYDYAAVGSLLFPTEDKDICMMRIVYKTTIALCSLELSTGYRATIDA